MEPSPPPPPSIDHQIPPRGGPIYHPDLIGPLTKPPDFETQILTQLQSLTSLLTLVNSEEDIDIDISVEELKLYSEEELVSQALTQLQQTTNFASVSIQQEKEKTTKAMRSNSSKKRTRRGRKYDRDTRAGELENMTYIEKVEKLARIKHKQDEDKIAAKLHSYNGDGSKAVGNEIVVSSSSLSTGNVKMLSLRLAKVRKSPFLNVNEFVKVCYPEVVLSVEVHGLGRGWVKTQEVLVLASQMVSVLKDKINCLTDVVMKKAGEFDSSGYFLIEDMFCNDKRDGDAIDYSEPIFDWLKKKKKEVKEKWECILSGELHHKQRALFGKRGSPQLPNFKAVDMHKVRFCDLSFRLGTGYLYCHQGDCKHVIVIRDMRLIHPEDVQNKAAYPIVTFQVKSRCHKCSVCKIYLATKVTVDDKYAEENPCYFCDNCYYLLHYNKDGILIYDDFTVFDHYD